MKPIRSRWIVALFCLPLCVVLPSEGKAFHVDGFWSGMSAQQFVFVAHSRGLMARPGAGGYWYLGAGDPPRPLSKVAFCGGRLVSYTRNILSDADYANILADIFRAYGPPRKMHFSGDVEPGVAAGAFRAMGFTLWARGADRVTMTSYFDWRLQRGQLFRRQPASVTFETLNPCNV